MDEVLSERVVADGQAKIKRAKNGKLKIKLSQDRVPHQESRRSCPGSVKIRLQALMQLLETGFKDIYFLNTRI